MATLKQQNRVDFNSNFKEVAKLVQQASRKSITKGLRIVARRARQLVPVSDEDEFTTGRTWRGIHYPDVHLKHTKNSIKVKVRGMKGNKDRTVGMVFTDSGVGAYIETGTVRMPAQPFLRPALEQKKDVFAKIMKADIALNGKRL